MRSGGGLLQLHFSCMHLYICLHKMHKYFNVYATSSTCLVGSKNHILLQKGWTLVKDWGYCTVVTRVRPEHSFQISSNHQHPLAKAIRQATTKKNAQPFFPICNKMKSILPIFCVYCNDCNIVPMYACSGIIFPLQIVLYALN